MNIRLWVLQDPLVSRPLQTLFMKVHHHHSPVGSQIRVVAAPCAFVAYGRFVLQPF